MSKCIRNKKILIRMILLGLSAGFFCFISNAQAVQIKRVQTGELSFDSVDIVDTATLAYPVNTTSSLVLVTSSSVASTRDGNNLFTPYFEDNENVAVARDYANVAAITRYHVIEFADGVRVTQGFSSMNKDTRDKTITLPHSVDSANAFVIVYTRGYITTNADTEVLFLKADLVSDMQLKLSRDRTAQEAGITRTINIVYQVVEFLTDSSLEKGLTTIPVSAYSVTQPLNQTIPDLSKAFLVFNFVGGNTTNGIEGDFLPRGVISDAGNLTFTRSRAPTGTRDIVDIKYYLLKLSGTTAFVQSNVTADTTISLTDSGTLASPTDITRTMPLISISQADTTSSTAYLDDLSFTVNQTANNTLSFARGIAADGAMISWFAVEFGPLTLKLPNGGTPPNLTDREVWQVGDNQTISWKYADSVAGDKVTLALCKSGCTNIANYNIIINSTINASYNGTGTPGTFNWNIPAEINGSNLINNTLWMSILDQNITNGRNYDISNNNFTIKGKLNVTGPIAASNWTVGESRSIDWTKKGNFDYTTFRIDVSTDGGGSYPYPLNTSLTQSQANCGSDDDCYINWTVGDYISSNAKVRVSLNDPSNLTNISSQSSDFLIRGALQILTPNATNFTNPILALDDFNITWNKRGNWTYDNQTNQVALYYWNDTLAMYTFINNTTSTGDSGNYMWLVPRGAMGNNVKLKIVSYQNATLQVENVSETFKVLPSVDLIYPTSSAEIWVTGQTQNITWDTASPMQVHVWYSTNGNGDPSNFTTAGGGARLTPPGGTSNKYFEWSDIPESAVSNNFFIRVAQVEGDTSPGTPYSDSAQFNCTGKIDIIRPNGGEVFRVGTGESIQWNNTGIAGNNVAVRLSIGPVNTTLTTISAASGTQSWTWSPVTNNITSGAAIRIELVSDPYRVFDTSNSTFSIKGVLTLITPDGGETFNYGNNTNITWTSNGTVGDVRLLYSKNNNWASPIEINASLAQGATPYNWSIPDDVSEVVKVRIEAVSDSGINDTSFDFFRIRGNLNLTSPDGGENLTVGSNYYINWTRSATSMGNITLAYAMDGENFTYPITEVASGLPAAYTGQYLWNPIPDSIGNNTKVKITLVTDANTTDLSQNLFRIRGKLVMNAPSPGDTWIVDSAADINWTSTGTISKVQIRMSSTGGEPYDYIIMNQSIGCSNCSFGYHWPVVNDSLGSLTRLKVLDFYDANVSTVTGNFTIQGGLNVTNPINGSEVWKVNETRSISWGYNGSLGNITIQYYNGTAFVDISGGATVPVAQASKNWLIPDAIGNSAKIKITAVDYPQVSNVSNGFKIKGVLALTAPTSSDNWVVNRTYPINWTKDGTFSGSAQLQYSVNGGANYTDIDTADSGALIYNWTVPDVSGIIGSATKIKIYLVGADADIVKHETANFTVKGNLTTLTPNATTVWLKGSTQAVYWRKEGPIANVKVKYSTDGGSTWPAGNIIENSTSAAVGSCSWTLPDIIGTNVVVNVSDAADSTVFNDSQVFAIKGSIKLDQPNGGESWLKGTTQQIKWTPTGTYNGNVKLEYYNE
ncbi:MAG: GPI anchored serine-threonine rich family protein, partial [Candidatus Omnitrophica bacterium]|nr:GPI anchored serine-threonine rich family protein [Candidatus Omnitrophota bacterium]